MISASHNSYEYNGIKIFSGDGYKLPDDLEERIESLILGEAALPPLPADSDLGTVSYAPNALRDYIDHVKSTVHFSLTGLEIALRLRERLLRDDGGNTVYGARRQGAHAA